MPSAPPRICPGCRATVPHGRRCTRCVKAEDQRRGASTQRGYDGQWIKLRASLMALPEFQVCRSCGQPATDLDHVLSVRDRPDLRLDVTNLRPLCHACHSRRTSREQRWGDMGCKSLR